MVVGRETWDDLLARDVAVDEADGRRGRSRRDPRQGDRRRAFAGCSTERAEMVEEVSGRPPRSPASSSRKKGDFDEILAASDVIVELIGGIDPARDYVTRALREGATWSPPTSSCRPARRRAGRGRARGRGPAALRGGGRRRDPGDPVVQESLGAIPIEKVFGIVNGTTNYILTEMAAQRPLLRGGPGAGPGAGLRRGRSDRRRRRRGRRGEDGDPGAPRVRRPGEARGRPLRGHRADQPDDLAYAKELGLSLKLLGVAERSARARSASGSSPASSIRAIRWPRSRDRSTRSWSRRRTITEITMSGPGAAGPRPPRRSSATSSR